ncbi:hypothetical protein [Demequina aurantiaca]|uniref:hypothetical protein n=1 Tax=Demequina aurantiaca TaxID=676200 RepID=UPI003D33E7A0
MSVLRPAQEAGQSSPKPGASVKAPTTPAEIRNFDFAAALFNDANAWRELARTIASDAA